MVMQRPMWMRHLLSRGYSVLQCDLDIVWLRDPFPLFATHPHLAAADVLVQSEGGHGYNAGFYFARPTRAADAFMEFWRDCPASKRGRARLADSLTRRSSCCVGSRIWSAGGGIVRSRSSTRWRVRCTARRPSTARSCSTTS
mmetsp:Transcript_18093/g.60706  ORF Transcript_18093/g.60706 Transcript_18093/m.60706 type:complete len:142 (+) Transcript_18093:521-946(+)